MYHIYKTNPYKRLEKAFKVKMTPYVPLGYHAAIPNEYCGEFMITDDGRQINIKKLFFRRFFLKIFNFMLYISDRDIF